MIIFGTAFFGKIEDYKDQRIETEFFHIFFIPLFPLSSIYVTSSSFRRRKGLDLALHSKSITAAYGRILTFLLAASTLLIAYIEIMEHSEGRIFYSILGLGFVASWIYLLFFYGKPTPQEIVIRDKIASCTGMYALPHWFNFAQAERQLAFFNAQYKQIYPENDWKADLRKSHVDTEKHKILYAISLFNCMTYDLPENEELYYKADSLYKIEQGI